MELLSIVCVIGGMNTRSKENCNKEATNSRKKNLSPVDLIVQEVVQSRPWPKKDTKSSMIIVLKVERLVTMQMQLRKNKESNL